MLTLGQIGTVPTIEPTSGIIPAGRGAESAPGGSNNIVIIMLIPLALVMGYAVGFERASTKGRGGL